MIDIHTHILPGLDDGCKTLGESVEALRIMKSSGVNKVVATPHYYHNCGIRNFLQKRKKAYESVMQCCKDGPEVILGAEVALRFEMHKKENLPKLCIEGTNYMLVELPYEDWNNWVFDELFKISAVHNINIIIAHIERYIGVAKRTKIAKLYDMDLKFQVTVDNYSNGLFRKFPSFDFIKNGKADFIASDCHNLEDRAPSFQRVIPKLRRMFGNDIVDGFFNNAQRMLENKIW